MSESLKVFSEDYHCRRILFGCSHDNGYARTLERFTDREEIVKKVVLLEGVPFEKELLQLPYITKKFPGLFRDSKIVLSINPFVPSGLYTPTPPATTKTYNVIAGLPTRFPSPAASNNVVVDSPLPSTAALDAPKMARTPSTSTLASDSIVAPKPVLESWAAKAAAPPPPPPPLRASDSPVPSRITRDDVIARNRVGQRIDSPSCEYDKAEVERVKKLKLCNTHYLRKECPFDTCTHDHTYKCSTKELETLRLVARMAPCLHGSSCMETRCIYGHRCPAPPARTTSAAGKSCIFGEACKFPPELHNIDTNIVKTLVVR